MLTAVMEEALRSFTSVKLYLAQSKKSEWSRKMSPVNVILSNMITLDYSDCALILKHDFTVAVSLGGAHLE